MKRVKSSQTAAHSVVSTLAFFPDFSTTRKQPLCLPLALYRLFCSWSTCRVFFFHVNLLHLLIFTSPCGIHLAFLLLCHEWKGARMLAEASGSELSIKTWLPHSHNQAKPLMAQKYLKMTWKIKKRLSSWILILILTLISYSYLQAIFSPFSLPSVGLTLLSWRRDE